jgi:hypothetical protein
MNATVQERFDTLLGFIKNTSHKLTVRENVAAARELLDTLLNTQLILPDDYRAYNAQIVSAKLVASANALPRETVNVGF